MCIKCYFLYNMDEKSQIEQFNKFLSQLLHSEEWERRAEAARGIGKIADGRATHMLVRALQKEKDPVVINNILEAIGKIKDKKATMPIVNFLKKELEKPEEDQDKQRLFVIIEALMRIGDKRALEHLGILLNSCHEDIKNLTEEAFECIAPNWKENIKKT